VWCNGDRNFDKDCHMLVIPGTTAGGLAKHPSWTAGNVIKIASEWRGRGDSKYE